MSFDKVGIANVDPSIQIDIGAEVVAVSNLSGAGFGLVGVTDIGPFIFVGVPSKNVHEHRDIAAPVYIDKGNGECLNVGYIMQVGGNG